MMKALLTPLLLLALAGPTPAEPSRPAPTPAQIAAMDSVLARDSVLGGIRNHASEDAPLHESLEAYVAELDSLDFEGCPPDFTAAFGSHRDAWHDSLEFFARFGDLRGELHDLFELIRAMPAEKKALEAIEAEIWGTWAKVEEARNGPADSAN